MKVCDKEIRVQGRFLRIARLEGEKYEFLDNPEQAVEDLRKSGTRVDLFTFIPRVTETSLKYNYLHEWDNLAVLPVSTFDAWWSGQIDGKTRNMVRKGQKKGLETRIVQFDDALLHGICNIYNERPVRQGRRFPHYCKDPEKVRQETITFLERSYFIGAYLGDRLVGFAKLVTDETRTQAGLMSIISMIEHRDKAPANMLVAEAVRCCADRGIPYLWYSAFTYGRKGKDSLTEFKESNGFQRVDLPRYWIPLTSVGRVALRLGLQHRIADRLPEPILARIRDLRSSWYKRRSISSALVTGVK